MDESASAKLIEKDLEFSLLSVDEPLITKMSFRPQDYAGTLKLVDAEAEIRAIRDEWERF